MNSFEIREWKKSIVDLINEANLPLEVKRMCLSEILTEVNAVCEQEINAIKKEKEEISNGTESSISD